MTETAVDNEGMREAAGLPRLSLSMAWWALSTAAFFIVVAPLLAVGVGAGNVLAGMAISVCVFAWLGGQLSRFAMRSGSSVAMLSRDMFGLGGEMIATLVLFATTLYYAVFEGSVVAIAAAHLIPGLDFRFASLIVATYSVVLVLGPIQRWLDRVNGLLLPVFVAGLLSAVLLASQRYALRPQGLNFRWALDPTGLWTVFSSYMGLWILLMCTVDFARLGRKADLGFHGRITFGLPFYAMTIFINGAVGLWLVRLVPAHGASSEISIVESIIDLMGVWGLVFLWATQTRINTANYYLAAVNLADLIAILAKRRVPYIAAAATIGVLAYALMLANIVSYLLLALAYQGIFVVAWVAIAVVHLWWAKDGAAPVPSIRMGGVMSWIAGVLAGIAMRWAGETAMLFSPAASALVAGAVYGVWLNAPARG